jgi:hypothetical protein
MGLTTHARVFALCIVAAAAFACGGGASSPSPTPTAPTAPTTPTTPTTTVVASGDNWSLRFDGVTGIGITGGLAATAPVSALEGSFNTSEGSVSAVMQPFGRCFPAPDTIRLRFTGTRTGNAIELQSQGLLGQVIRINVTLSARGDAVEGTYSLVGGCSTGTTGPVSGRRVELTGIWSGTMGAIPTVIDLRMAGTPDSDANFALSGTVRFSSTQCFANAVITRRARGRIMFPDVQTDTQRLELIAEVSEDMNVMQLDYVLVTGTCPELSSGTGRLVRQ